MTTLEIIVGLLIYFIIVIPIAGWQYKKRK